MAISIAPVAEFLLAPPSAVSNLTIIEQEL